MRVAARWLAAIVLPSFLAAPFYARPDAPAAQTFGALSASMRSAYDRRDWQRYRSESRELIAFLNGSPDALLELARADARTGDPPAAIGELQTIAGMGVSQIAIHTLPDFAPLRGSARFQAVLDEMASNAKPFSHATRAFTLPDVRLLPEDIAYDPTAKRFLLTSVLENRIVTLDANGRTAQFAPSPDGLPMLAVRVDARHGIVWATEAALNGFRSVPKGDWGRSVVLEYDLRSHRLLRRVEGPKPSQLGDVTLTPAGDLLIADSNGGGLYLASRNGTKLVQVDGKNFVSPMTPAFAGDAKRVFVADYVRGIGALDLDTHRVAWIPMGNEYALQGTDGMYCNGGRLIAIQNGIVPERVTIFSLAAGGTRVAGQRAIESGTNDLDPSHGVVVGNVFYYIANSGWNELAVDGSVRRGARLTPARIMRAPI